MGVNVKMEIDMREVRDYLNREYQKHLHRTIAMLQNVGETVVNQIRTSDISEWNDQTGNLRSSIGYVITVDGEPINFYGFQQVDGPKRGTAEDPGYNQSEAEGYALQVAALYPENIALIVVAGMEYASYVEKRDNKVVLAQGEIVAKTLIAQMMQKLDAKLNSNK